MIKSLIVQKNFPNWRNDTTIEVVKQSATKKKFLVYLCTYSQSERYCFRDHKTRRNFDIVTRYFSKPEDGDHMYSDATVVCTGGLSKFHSAAILNEVTGLFQHYEYMMFLDDDVDISIAGMNDFFRVASALKMDLCQPALSHQSSYSWRITLLHPNYFWRETDFVEVMMPCFSKRALHHVIDSFPRSISSYGLDFVWPHILKQKLDNVKIGIIDACVVTHRKRVNRKKGAFYNYLRSINVDYDKERSAILKHYGVKKYFPRILEGSQIGSIPKFARRMSKSLNFMWRAFGLRFSIFSIK